MDIYVKVLYVILYVSTFHDVSESQIQQTCEPKSQYGASSWAHDQEVKKQLEFTYRVYAMQLLEYTSNAIFYTVLWCKLSLPVEFVSEYIKIQPLLKTRLDQNSWMHKTNMRPDACFEAVFKILFGLVVLVAACIDNRLHGLLLGILYMFDLVNFYQKEPPVQVDEGYNLGSKRSAPRQNIYCCKH